MKYYLVTGRRSEVVSYVIRTDDDYDPADESQVRTALIVDPSLDRDVPAAFREPDGWEDLGIEPYEPDDAEVNEWDGTYGPTNEGLGESPVYCEKCEAWLRPEEAEACVHDDDPRGDGFSVR